jgi:hypothetical protein
MRIEVKDNTVFRDGGKRAEEIVLRAAQRFLGGVLRFGKLEWSRRLPRDTGGFIRTLYYRTSRKGGKVEGVLGSTAPPVLQSVMEHGRRPGAPMPPRGVLLPWMRRHGIPEEMEFPVRRAIGEKGRPATNAQAHAFRRIKGLLEGGGLRGEIVKDLNRG